MDQLRRRVVATVFLTLLPLMSIVATPAPAASGVEGVISVSPARPGPLRIGDPSSAPVAKIEFVVKKGDTRVTSFTTDAEGRFRIALPPGKYIVLREDPGAVVGSWRFEVEVTAGEVTKVNWTGDSGMR